jgi:hypothetical protein
MKTMNTESVITLVLVPKVVLKPDRQQFSDCGLGHDLSY